MLEIKFYPNLVLQKVILYIYSLYIMISLPCELCDKTYNSLRYWFGKLLCPKCYEIERFKPQTIVVGNMAE